MASIINFKKLFSISILRGFVSIIPYVGNIYIARQISPNEFGEYFFFLSVVPFVLSFFAYNIHAGYRVKFTSKPELSKSVALNIFIFFQIIALIALVLIMIFEKNFILLGFNNYEILLLCLFCHLSVCISLFESKSLIMQSAKRFFFSVFFPITIAWILSLYFFRFDLSWQNRILYYSVSIYSIYLIYFFRVYLQNGIIDFYSNIKEMMSLGIHLVLPAYFLGAIVFFDRYLYKNNLAEFEFGLLSYAMQIILLFAFGLQILIILYEQVILRSQKISKLLSEFSFILNLFLIAIFFFISYLIAINYSFITEIVFNKTASLPKDLILNVAILAFLKVMISIESVNYYVSKEESKIIFFYLLSVPFYLFGFAIDSDIIIRLYILIFGNLLVILSMIMFRKKYFKILSGSV